MENVKLLRGKPQKFIPIFIWSLSVTFPGYKNMFLGDYSGKIPHFISPLPSNPFLSCVSDRRRAEPSSWSGRKNVFLKLRWTQRSLHILPQLNSKAAPLHKLRLASLLKVYARKGLSFKFLKTFIFFRGTALYQHKNIFFTTCICFTTKSTSNMPVYFLYPKSKLFLTDSFIVLFKVIFILFNGEGKRKETKDKKEKRE